MPVKHSARRYDAFDAGEYANPDARTGLISGPDGLTYTWEWDDKSHTLKLSREEIEEELLLQKLFEAAIKMAKM